MFANKEPAFVFGGLATLVGLIIPMLQLFELIHWSDKQIAGFMAVILFASNFIAALLTRSGSVSLPVANKQIEVAKASDVSRPTSEIVAQAAKETA